MAPARAVVRVLLLLVAFLLLPATGALASTTDTSPPQPTTPVLVLGEVSAAAVVTGQPVTFAGGGFTPGTQLELASDGVPLLSRTADSSGAFLTSLTLPPGTHLLAARGVQPNRRERVVQAAVAVTDLTKAATVSDRSSGRSNHTVPALLVGLGLVLLYSAGSLTRSRVRPARRR